MSLALSTGVTGLKAYQQQLDIAGNNLANIGTTGFKTSRMTFAQLLCETIRNASQPTTTVGGTNPVQMGSGVGIAGITSNMNQGNIINTGNPLDLAIEGDGFFVLNDGGKDIYTRAGAFGVDANSYLVDPATGYRVQRIGSEGEYEGFQIVGDSNIRVPYDAALPAKATTSMTVQGNLSPDATSLEVATQTLKSDITFTVDGSPALATTKLSDLDQVVSGTLSGTIYIDGYDQGGTAFTQGSLAVVDGTTTMQDLLDEIDTTCTGTDGGTATLEGGKIVLTGATSGYSKLDLSLSYTAGTTEVFTMPGYFEYTTVGGMEVQNVNITTYDSLGAAHVFSGALVRTDTSNTWDMVIASITGDITELTYANRRINSITFDPSDGSYSGVGSTAQFTVTYAHDPADPQTIAVDLGTATKFDGLTQFATGETGTSTAVIKEQDGYTFGSLSDISVNKEGIMIGLFSNGAKKNLATVQIALFQNAAGLETIDNGYYISSANSGNAVATNGLASGAGAIHGSSLEKSNVQEAEEFIRMIEAQNAYQANARTIRVANEMLRELTQLIR